MYFCYSEWFCLHGLGTSPDISLALHLFQSICVPILLYGTAAISLTSNEKRKFSFAFNSFFVKLFKIKNNEIIEACQFHSHILPFSYLYDASRLKFLLTLVGNDNGPLVLTIINRLEVNNLCEKYDVRGTDSNNKINDRIWANFERRLSCV